MPGTLHCRQARSGADTADLSEGEVLRMPKRRHTGDFVLHTVSPTLLGAQLVRRKYDRQRKWCSPLSETARKLLLTRLTAPKGVFLSFGVYLVIYENPLPTPTSTSTTFPDFGTPFPQLI